MLLSLPAVASPLVYGESAMVKVRTLATPRADTGVGLTGAQNEFVSFQVVVNGGDTGATGVSATFALLSGPGGHILGGADLTLYRETYLNITSPSFATSGPGLWPDGLVPDLDEIAHEKRAAFPMTVPAHQARALWADIHIPTDAPAGLYSGAVQVTGDSGLTATVQVTLTVAPFTLPSTASLSTAFLISTQNVCLAHTGDPGCWGDTGLQNSLLSRYAQMALEHRVTLANLWTMPHPGEGWEAYDANAKPLMNGTTAARLPGAQATSLEYQGPQDVASYAAFQAHLVAQGWLSRAFDYTGDEPPINSSFVDIHNRAALVRRGAPGLNTLVTTSQWNAAYYGILNDVDNLTPVVNWLDGVDFPYLGDQRAAYSSFLGAASRRQLWTYQSCMSQGCNNGSRVPENSATAGWPTYLVDAPAARNRSMEWMSFLEHVHGELYYDTALSLPTAFSDQRQFNGNGDGNLFYPGTSATIGGDSDVPVASIRMKLLRMGLQDFEWLKRVASDDPAFATAVAQALIPNAWEGTNDGAAFERAKLQLVSRLNELLGAPAPTTAQGSPPDAPAMDVAQAVQTGVDPVTTYVAFPAWVTGDTVATTGAVGGPESPSSSAAVGGDRSAAPQALGAARTGCGAVPLSGAAIPSALAVLGFTLVRRRR